MRLERDEAEQGVEGGEEDETVSRCPCLVSRWMRWQCLYISMLSTSSLDFREHSPEDAGTGGAGGKGWAYVMGNRHGGSQLGRVCCVRRKELGARVSDERDVCPVQMDAHALLCV